MKQSMKRMTGVLAGTLLLASAGSAIAFGGPGGYGKAGCHHGAMNAVYQLKNLTDDQRNQLEALQKQRREDFGKIRDQLRDTRRKLRDAIQNDDMKTVRTLAEKQGDQITAMIIARAETRAKVNGILTEAQRKQLRSMLESQREHGRHGW